MKNTKSISILLLILMICSLFSSCGVEMTGRYIPEDQYSSDIIIDSIEFLKDSKVHIEAGGESINLEYKIEDEAFELIGATEYTVDGEELPDVYIYKRISLTSFSLNGVVYVIEDSLKNQDRDNGSFDETTEELIEEYIDSENFQSFIDSYSKNVESSKNVNVDAYASGNTLVIEIQHKNAVGKKTMKKVRNSYKKYLNSLYKNKNKRNQLINLRKSSNIKGMKLKIIVVDSNGSFIAEKNF